MGDERNGTEHDDGRTATMLEVGEDGRCIVGSVHGGVKGAVDGSRRSKGFTDTGCNEKGSEANSLGSSFLIECSGVC